MENNNTPYKILTDINGFDRKVMFNHTGTSETHNWTAFSDYTGPDLLCSTVFHF